MLTRALVSIRTALANLSGSHWDLSASLSSTIILYLLNLAHLFSLHLGHLVFKGTLTILYFLESSPNMPENVTGPP